MCATLLKRDDSSSKGWFLRNTEHIFDAMRKVYEAGLVWSLRHRTLTLILTVPLGFMLARGVTRRINRLSAAINLVAEGDLYLR